MEVDKNSLIVRESEAIMIAPKGEIINIRLERENKRVKIWRRSIDSQIIDKERSRDIRS